MRSGSLSLSHLLNGSSLDMLISRSRHDDLRLLNGSRSRLNGCCLNGSRLNRSRLYRCRLNGYGLNRSCLNRCDIFKNGSSRLYRYYIFDDRCCVLRCGIVSEERICKCIKIIGSRLCRLRFFILYRLRLIYRLRLRLIHLLRLCLIYRFRLRLIHGLRLICRLLRLICRHTEI